MNKFIIAYFSALVPLLVIDGIWLTLMSKRFYAPLLGNLLAKNIQIAPVILFYVIYAVGITIFIVLPALQDNYSALKIMSLGGLLGLVAYGAYDFTNQATLQNWSTLLTVVDLCWGTTVTALTAIIATKITRFF
ncbi:MAG: DUF2177 family protein [Candidatus Dependentiae bacterium]|nr:DUF2177 family protein [Candidatus Dependentiae bacterium]